MILQMNVLLKRISIFNKTAVSEDDIAFNIYNNRCLYMQVSNFLKNKQNKTKQNKKLINLKILRNLIIH